jgi:predicted MFS family arabinose efflux permease
MRGFPFAPNAASAGTMTDLASTTGGDARARRNVVVLVAMQAILGSQMPMVFIVGGLAGHMLASNPCLATLPISLVVFGSMTTAPWISTVMQRYGRTAGFMIGAGGGAIGAAVAAYGLYANSFPIFLLGSYFTGIYVSAQGFYRFAAADAASDAFRPKAISYVMAGGLASALIGPQLVKAMGDVTITPFLGVYMTIVALNLVGTLLFPFLNLPRPSAVSAEGPEGRSRRDMLRDPRIITAIIVAMVSYALMNLVMTSTPLAVVGSGFEPENAADIVSAHVLAMYVPSFFTGHLIARFGTHRIMSLGLLILGGAGVVALTGMEIGHFFVALVLLGVGWNFGFIGATTLLTASHRPEERGRVQGMNDAIVFGMVTVASLASGGLMNCSGGSVVAGWTAVNLAMVPFLVLAAGVLIWLWLRPKTAG